MFFTITAMLDFLDYQFMQRAILAGFLIASAAPLIGIFVVARKASLLSDTFAHTALAGVGLGLVLGFNPILGALAIAIFAALSIENLIDRSRLSHDAIQAIFLSGGLALAVLLTHLQDQATIGFKSYLFGSLLTVTWNEVILLAATLLLVGFFVHHYYWKFLLVSVNESLAQAKGVPVERIKKLISLLTALVVALSLKIVGALLVGALIVLPVLSASLIAKSFKSTLLYSIFFSWLFVLLGLIASYFLDVPSGSSIVLIGILVFVLTMGLKHKRLES